MINKYYIVVLYNYIRNNNTIFEAKVKKKPLSTYD